jgi:hypothetical protein
MQQQQQAAVDLSEVNRKLDALMYAIVRVEAMVKNSMPYKPLDELTAADPAAGTAIR